jgi:phage shock protein PspC (stress-responsive transcriptional regulator)
MTSPPNQTPDATGTAAGTAGTSGTSGPAGPAGPDGTTEQPPGLPPHQTPGYGGEQRLHRGDRGRMLAGVAVGLADYFDVDPTIVRVGFVALAFLGGLAVPLYLAGWLLIPDEDSDVSVAEELLARERARGAF